jgi:plasmid replication initiation protein
MARTPDGIPEQGDLFLCNRVGLKVKDDLATMDLPVFALSKNKDLEIREYRRGNRTVKVIPSGVGAATIYDKDLLIYATTQIVDAANNGLPVSRAVVIDSGTFLAETKRGDGRASYERIHDMLMRLKGTFMETNIETGGIRQTQAFGFIEDYEILSERSRQVKAPAKNKSRTSVDITRVIRFSITLSEWMFNGILNKEILTTDVDYFKLSSGIDRRLYEIARRHCGDQPLWKINIDLLGEKLGTRRSRAKLRDDIRSTIEADCLPEYRIALDTQKNPDHVVFYTRDGAKLMRELVRSNSISWFESLERHVPPALLPPSAKTKERRFTKTAS